MATKAEITIDTTYGHPLFYELVAQMARTHAVKNQDYGGGNPLGNFYGVKQFNGDPVEGVMTRLSDKWSRLCNLHAKGGQGAVKDESIEDTALDLACYSLLYTVIRRECNNGGGPRLTVDLGALEPDAHIEEVKKQVEEERHQAELRLKAERDKWYRRYLDMESNYLNLVEDVGLLQMDKAGIERELEGLRAQVDQFMEFYGPKGCLGCGDSHTTVTGGIDTVNERVSIDLGEGQ